MLAKFYLAGQLNLFGDEAFYWLESQHLALAYSDVPWLTPLLVHFGTELFGDTTFGVRFFFILLANSLPFVLYLLCKPIFSKRIALFGAALITTIPLLASLGIAATPDTPLISLQLLLTLCLYHALNSNQWRDWLLAGFIAAFCFGAHYRFAIFIGVFGLYLLLQSLIRMDFATRIWRNPKFYTALSIALVGLIPSVIYNSQQEWAAFNFHFSERHPWQFNIKGLLYPFVQMLVASPLMFFALLAASIYCFKIRHKLSAGEFMLFFIGTGYWLFFALLSPISDARSTTVHWPIFSYLLLLPLLVKALVDFSVHCYKRYKAKQLSGLQLAASYFACRFSVSLGCALSLAVMLYGGLISQVEQLPFSIAKKLSYKMSGWEALAHDIKGLDTDNAVIVTNNYYTAAQLAFYHTGQQIYTLDNSKVVRDGRATQIKLLAMNERALLDEQLERNIIYVHQQGKNPRQMGQIWSAKACTSFTQVELLKRSSSFQKRKSFDIYQAKLQPKEIESCIQRCYAANIAPPEGHRQLAQNSADTTANTEI